MAVDPDVQRFLDQLSSWGFPKMDSLSPAELREYMSGFAVAGPPGPKMERVEDHTNGMIPLRFYLPPTKPRAVINYMHGGGWTIGGIEEADAFCRILATRMRCAVISVGYRHGPEDPFPAAVDDCLAAAQWATDNMDLLVGQRLPLILAGDSAGGNLSAVVAILARDKGAPEIGGQILLNPCTDGDIDAEDLDAFESPFLTKAEINWFFDQYIPARSMRTDPRFAPIRAERHENLPPAFILTAQYDLLHAQGESYAMKLRAANVATVHKCYTGTIHSFLVTNCAPRRSEEAFADIDAFISRYIAR